MKDSLRPIEEVIRELEERNNPSKVDPATNYNTTLIGNEENTIQDIKRNVPVDAIYSRLSDGSYSAKYDNYRGAVGNEDRLAREQGAFEQAITGLTKNVAKVGLYAADATIGTAYGIASALDKGEWKGFWDNDFSRGIDDLNTKLDNNLANYYTDEQKNMGVLRSMLTTNFWFNDVAGGLAFVGGAILPEVAIGILTGGTSLGVSAAKMAAKYGGKSVLKAAAKAEAKAAGRSALNKNIRAVVDRVPGVRQYKAGTKALRDINTSIYRNKAVGDFIGTTAFLARSSGFEAGMEARHNYKEAIENYVANYEAMNGELPGYEELTAFVKDAESAANGVFATNLALLSVSNSVMFADKFKIAQGFRKDLSRKFDSYIGLGVKVEGGKIVAQQATKGQKALGKTYKILAKPAVEGLYEEGLQGVAGKTMQNYLTAKYDPNSDQTVDVMAATMDALKEQYSSKEGWKEMVIGMIIGSGAGLLQKQGVAGLGKNSWTARSKEIAKQTKVANASLENLTGNINRATVMSNLANQIESGQSVSQVVDIESSLMHKEYIKTQETFKSQEQILEDYETIVEKMELSDQELKQIGGVENLDTYKNQLRETFKRDLSNYNEAVKLTEALGIENIEIPGKGKLNKGNTLGLKDFVQTNLMLGYAAEQGAMQIAETIGAVTGESGIYSAMNVVSGLKEQQVKTLDKIKEKQQRLSELREVSERYLRQMESSSTQETAEKYQRHAELYTKTIAEEQQLEEEVARLSSSLSTVETMQEGGQFELEGLENVLVDQGILSAMEKLDKMDAYIKVLKQEGREKEAKDLEYLIQEYKNQADAARETKKFYADMASGRFLQGKKSLPSIILGDNYKLEEGTKKIIEENELEIDRALGAVGYRGPEKALEKFNELVANNPNLSDREKFKIDRYVRMFLTQSEYANQAHRREESESEVETTRSNSLTKGDTITIKDNPKYSAEELGDIETLNKIIADMEQAIKDYRKSGKELRNPIESRNQTESNTELQQLEAQLAELKEKANSLGDDSQVQDLAGNTYSVNESDITTYETESGPIRYITNENGDMVMLSDKNTDAVREEIDKLKEQLADFYSKEGERESNREEALAKIAELENKISKLQEEHERKVEEYRPEEVKFKEEASPEETDKRNREVAEENKKVDELVESRRDKGVPSVDFLSDFSESQEAQLSRVEGGIPTSLTTVRELSDYFYSKYKQLSDMRKNPRSRVEFGMTDEDVVDLMTELAITLDFLSSVESAMAEQGTLPVFAPQTVSSIREEIRSERSALIDAREEALNERDELIGRIVELEKSKEESNEAKGTREKVASQIEQLEKQIEELKNQPTPETKEVDTGINRLSELEAKEVKQELTEEEAEELNELRNEIDDWILASGTVYQGFRLSDLIRQREVLLNTPIEKVEKVDIVSDADLKASVEIPDRQSKGNYALAQHYDGVTATRVKDGDGKGTPMIEIHNTRPERFTEEVGFEFPYTTNTKGNILVTEEIAERINSDSNVRIETTKDATGSNYTTVKVRRVNLKGEAVWEDLKSDYNEETTKPQNTDALYAMKEGEAIQFEIDPKDSYNQKLIEEYKKTGNKTKLKNSLLIRVLDSKGNFVSVLKGKEKNNKVFKDSKRFEAFRDNIIENEEYFEMITESTLPIIIEGHNAKVDKVLIGHPNTRQEYVALTKDDSAVQDIGFVEKGKVWTKSQKGDVDTTFLSRSIKNSKSDAKIPFLVFNRGGRRIAYPVKFIQGDNTAVEELTRVYNSNTAQVDKVVALNKILASRGIDIKEGGNAFVTTRDFTNLTDEFFNSKVAQLENRPYIQNLENWKGSSMSLDAIIGQGILHNLNLDSPISSPKLQMDLSKLNVKPTAFSQVKNETGQKDSTKDAIDSNKNQAEKDLNEDC